MGKVLVYIYDGIDDPFPREGFVDKRVVVDKNIITTKGIAFINFAIKVCDYLDYLKMKIRN